MHNPDYSPSNNFTRVHFTERFVPIAEQPKLGDLIQSQIDNRQYFYGIELSAKSNNSTLDYRKFTVLPLFTSLVWFSPYGDVDPISEVESLQFGKSLQPGTVVMPHFTCYRTTPERVKKFLSLDFANVVALRGDDIEADQSFKYASDLVSEIRKIRGDTITIAVAGYPQGHPQAKSMEEDMTYLKQKVNSGADFIITQICFNSSSIIEFIGNCRKNGITVPIIVGVYVPENYRTLRRMLAITQVKPPEQMHEYKSRHEHKKKFKEYAVETAAQLIKDVFNSDSGVYGIQFYSMNYFESVEKLVNDVIAKYNAKELK